MNLDFFDRKDGRRIYEGDFLIFETSDSYFEGHIVSLFSKDVSFNVRCVVQDDRGLLLIKNPELGQFQDEYKKNPY